MGAAEIYEGEDNDSFYKNQPYRTPAKRKPEPKEKFPMKMPLIVYVLATGLCFTAAGVGCDLLSSHASPGNCSGAGFGVSTTFCLFAFYIATMGILKFIKDGKKE